MWIIEKWKNLTHWLDQGGKPAWIIAIVTGFAVFWPVGILLTINFLSCKTKGTEMKRGLYNAKRKHTGNTAFDQYREETITRLEEERGAFEGFLDRLRDAQDKENFDRFMSEYRSNPRVAI